MKFLKAGILLAGVCLAVLETAAADGLDFNRDVRPILSNKCFRCHGFDEKSRQANLRLDVLDSATAKRDGQPAIVPGRPEESELIRRIEASDPDDRMPPLESNQTLSNAEKETLRSWIANGARYQLHWSLTPPQASPSPKVQHSRWLRNEVDCFVLARLEREGLQPSAEASPETLLRRVSFDLTGLPPTLEELDQYLADHDHDGRAYERAVDRLLSSPHFGERLAVEWLDVARYADTNGYFGDKTRSAWPWRDWVIRAYNDNLPFDQFTVEQLAGDLLPNPTTEQRIATGFNRNHMANNESGLIDEEYRTEYVADRLETTAATWLGLTIGCARCHDHKFDPITQKDFYQLFAFFNNVPEAGLITQENPPPVLEVPSPQQEAKLKQLVAARDAAEQAFAPTKAALQKQIAVWEESAANNLTPSPQEKMVAHFDFDDRIIGRHVGTTIKYDRGVLGLAATFDATQHAELENPFDVDGAWTIGIWLRAENSLGCVLSKIEPTGSRRGLEVLWQKGRFQIHLVNRWGVSALEVVTNDPLPSKTWQHLVLGYDGSRRAAGLKVFLNGQLVSSNIERDTLAGSLVNAEPMRIARRDSGLGFYGQLDELRILQRNVTDREVQEWFWSERLRGITATPADARTAADNELLLDYYLERHADAAARESRRLVVASKKRVADLRAAIPTALVMQELAQPRRTALLTRGQYDHPADVVQANVPDALAPWPAEAPRNRLGLARWLASPTHPLTARVAVNRLWQQCFGEGIVRTASDFGSQGDPPTHPELLDWLAAKFMLSGWDVKSMLRLMVTSAAYRQSSAATTSLLQRDVENRLLARGPRFRLSAEMVRDQALAASGLLVPRIGGPSVKPYQPPGLWEAVSYNGEESYVADQGEGLWRRSLYTFWKRQAPPPALLTFDGPTREKCTVRRARTNTPLQALVLLNDQTYLEAARHLATLTLAEPGADRDRLQLAFRRVTSRQPDQEELAVLVSLLRKQRTRYTANPTDAAQLLAGGTVSRGRELDSAEFAAWTVTLHALFNLDEVITRR